MKNRLLAILLTLSMVLSLAIVPATAGENKTGISFIPVSFTEKSDSITEGIELSELNKGDIFALKVLLRNPSAKQFYVRAYDLWIQYNEDVLEQYTFKSGRKTVGPVVDGEMFAPQKNIENGIVKISGADADGTMLDAKGGEYDSAVVVYVLFKVKSDVESCLCNFALVGSSNKIYGAETEEDTSKNPLSGVTFDVNTTITVNGVTPTINTVSLDKSSVTVNGTEGATVKAQAFSAKGTDITNSVAWSVSDGNDVSIAEDGTITVDAKAEAGTYTITASAKEGSSQGRVATGLMVTRAPAKAATITLTRHWTDLVVPYNGQSGAGFLATVKDQYGDEMKNAEVKWSITPQVDGVSINENSGEITVLTKAKDTIANTTGTTFTVTATCGDATEPATFTVKRAAAEAKAIVISGGVASLDIPATGSVDTTFTAEVTDQYDTEMTNADVKWSIEPQADGVSINENTGAVTVLPAAKNGIANTTGTTFTVTATSGNVSTTKTITVKRAQSVATSIKVYRNGTELTGNTDTVIVPTTDTANEYTYTAKAFDQYGAEMTGTVSVSITPASSTGVTVDGSKLIVSKGAQKDAQFTVNGILGSLTKSITVTVKDIDITWPTVTEKSGTYGQKWSEIVKFNGGSAVLNGESVAGTFTLVNADSVPNVGDRYQLVFKSNDGQYTVTSVEADAVIAKAPLTITAKNATVTYGEAPANNGVEYAGFVNGDQPSNSLTGNLTYTYGDYAAGKDAGTYPIVPAGVKAENYEITFKNGTLTVSPKALTVTAGNLKITKIYDGTNNAGVAAENTKLGLEGVVNNDNVQVSYTTIGAYADANVGSGKAVTISGLSLTGAKASNYTISASEQQITAGEITKADLTAKMLSFAPASTVYDGTAKTVSVTLNAAYTGMGEVTVKYDGAVSATNAKTYDITADVTEGTNFNAAAGLPLGEFTIQPKSIAGVTIEGIGANGYEFTGSEIKPAITVKDGDKTLRADTDYTVTYTGNTNVGTATLTVAGKGNYDSATTKRATFKITKTQPKIGTDYTVTIPTADLTYSGMVKEATVEKTNTNIGSITVKYNGSTVKPVNAGTYAVTVDITESANYAAMTAVDCGSFTIATKDITVSGVTLQDKTYNGRTDDAVVTAVTFDGLVNNETLTLGTDFTATAVYDNANASDNAAAKATVTMKDTVKANNYNLTSGTDLAATGKVEKATTTLSLSAANAVYTGTAYDENKIAKTSNVETAPTYTYYTDEGCTAAVAGGKPVGVGTYWVKGVIDATTNNTDAAAKAKFQITKAPLTITANDKTITYGAAPANDGAKFEGLVNKESAESVVSGLTYAYNYEQYGNVGAYTITPKDATAANYEIKFVSGKLTVEQKEVGLTWNNASTLYYDGKAKNVTATATGLENNDAITVTVAGGKQTDIGSYSAAATGLTGAKAGNYKLPADNTKAYKIEAALTSVTVDPATITATIDGLTIKLVGYKNADADITISAVNATVDGDKLTVNGVEYTIDDSAVVVKSAEVNVKQSETETAKADGADDTITNEVLNAINVADTKGEGLEKAAASLIESISEGKPEGTSSIEVTFVLKIQPKTYKDGKLTLVIEPYVKRVFKNANDEVIGEEQETKISNSELKSFITVSIKLPTGFHPNFAKHLLASGGFEMIKLDPDALSNGVAKWQQSSFSEVTLVSDTRTATITFKKDDKSTITKIYTAANIGEALPTDSKAGYTYNGWTVGDKTYKTLTDEALTAMAALAEGKRTLTASFTQNGGGSIGGGGGGGGAATYPVSVDKAENGTVTVSPKSAVKGGTVTIEVKPDEGYELASVTVLDKDGKKLEVTLKNGKYSFVMPDGKVSIKAEFAKKGAMSFADVAANSWYYDAVKYCFDNGLMNGVGEDKFAPSATTTRAMIWTVLARDAGVDTSTGATWYEAGMKWAVENKISDGTGAENAITREQFATMLYRVAQSKGEGFSGSWYFPLSFDDAASISDWADEAMHWCVMKGILNGSNNKLNPTDNASRAEVAAMLMRFLTLDK